MASIGSKSDILRASAELHGQHGDHEKALEILVYELNDYDGAFNYCIQHSKSTCSTDGSKRKLFHTLLGIYLNHPLRAGSDSVLFRGQALKLLNSPHSTFDPIQVLSMIPNEWNISEISEFLIKSFRTMHHEKCSTSIEKGLLESESKRLQLLQVKNPFEEPYLITSATTCDVCSLPFEHAPSEHVDEDDYPAEINPFESTSISPESFPTSSYSSSSSKSRIDSSSKDIILIPSHNQLIHAKCYSQLDPGFESLCNSLGSR